MQTSNEQNNKPKRLVIIGATGMVGGYALRYALEHRSRLEDKCWEGDPAEVRAGPKLGYNVHDDWRR